MKESIRLGRFVIIGTLNYLITMLVFWLMMTCLSFKGDYIVANFTAYLVAQTHNFIWSKYWIFPTHNSRNSLWKQILLFSTAFAVAYTIQFLLLIGMVEIMGLNEYVAQLIGIIVYGAVNFIANKKITFR